jgi:hypothetical protein
MQVSYDDYVAMCGAAKALGLPAMLTRYGIDMNTWTQVSGGWNAAIAQAPMAYSSYGVMVEQEAARVAAGGPLRPLGAPPPYPPQPQPQPNLDQAANALGNAAVVGFNALGSAFNALGREVAGIAVGTQVLVAWSDGQRYPGTVVQVVPGQYLVAMGNGQQHWVPMSAVYRP